MDTFNNFLADLEKLTEKGVLGFYNCIEVTEIFALNRDDRKVINVITHLVYENVAGPEFEKERYLNRRNDLNIPSLKKWYFGIKRYYISLESIKVTFEKLINNRIWNSCKESILTCDYKFNPYKFIPSDTFNSNVINNLLKNNFFGGSYLIEFEDKNKHELSFLLDNPSLLQELSSKIYALIPLKIASVSDKLGGVLVQIPVNIIRTNVQLLSNNEDLHCKIIWHPESLKREIFVSFKNIDQDSNIDSYYSTMLNSQQNEIFYPSKYDSTYEMTIWDPLHKVLLYATHPSSFIRTISLSMRAINDRSRIIPLKDASFDKIPLYSPHNSIIGGRENHAKKWSSIRIYRSEREQLLHEKKFIQYNAKGKFKETERSRALNDIRSLINSYGENGIWLWDPYLNGNDLLETLFYNTCMNSKMRAITSSKYQSGLFIDNVGEVSDAKYDNDSFARLSTLPAQTLLGLNIEVRKPFANYGWGFHDRFLIFPYTDNEPVAWSIGTSINSIGKEHHILQKVSDAQLIADAFEELWRAIQHPDCLVWSTYGRK